MAHILNQTMVPLKTGPRRKRILHIITGLGTGGAERMLVKLLGILNQGPNEHFVISLMTGGSQSAALSRAEINVFPIGMTSLLSIPGKLPRLISIARRLQPDLIQGWMYHGNLAACLISLGLFPRPPVLWNIRHSVYDIANEKLGTRLVIRLNAMMSPFADKILYNAPISCQQHEALNFARRALIVPNGFSLSHFRPDPPARDRLLDELGLNPEAIIVGHVARFHPMKDQQTLLRAFGNVIASNDLPHLVMVGMGLDRANAFLGHQIERLGLAKRVHLMGERSEVERLMPGFDVFALSSAWGEGFPNVLGEAMACGVPCVATDIGESAQIIGNQGVIVPPRDAEELAKGILMLLDLSVQRRREMGRKARDRIASMFSMGHVAERYESLYESLPS